MLDDWHYFHCKDCYASTPNRKIPEDAENAVVPRDYIERMGNK